MRQPPHQRRYRICLIWALEGSNMQTVESVPQEEEKPLSRRRKRLPISFILGGLAILAAVIYLVYANTQANAVYYFTVSELKNCSICSSQSVRVAGVVQPGSIVHNDRQQQIRFVISDGGHSLPVVYSGIVPDIFRPGITVVVEGHYSGQG